MENRIRSNIRWSDSAIEQLRIWIGKYGIQGYVKERLLLAYYDLCYDGDLSICQFTEKLCLTEEQLNMIFD